jgi:hypothetical protein
MANLALGVVGPGPANRDNIGELLSDWLGFGAPDEEGYLTREVAHTGYTDISLVLPLTDEHYTPGVAMVQAWSALADLEYVGVIDMKTAPRRREVKAAKNDAADLVASDDATGAVLDLLTDALEKGDDTVLLVLQDDQEPDAAVSELIAAAATLRIPVLNLSFGLAPIVLPEEQETATEEVPEVEAVVWEDTAVLQETPEDAAADEDPVKAVFDTLDTLFAFHNAQDTLARLYNTGSASGQASPLTAGIMRTIFILQDLLAPKSEAPADDPVNTERPTESLDAKATRLRAEAVIETGVKADDEGAAESQVKSAKTRREWFDAQADAWRPVGRGRPRKDVEFRDVPVDA